MKDRVYVCGSDPRINGSDVSKKNYNFTLLCLDGKSGKMKWNGGLNSEINCAPVVSNGRVLVVERTGNLVCFNDKTGRKMWRKNCHAYSPLKSKVYSPDSKNNPNKKNNSTSSKPGPKNTKKKPKKSKETLRRENRRKKANGWLKKAIEYGKKGKLTEFTICKEGERDLIQEYLGNSTIGDDYYKVDILNR